ASNPSKNPIPNKYSEHRNDVLANATTTNKGSLCWNTSLRSCSRFWSFTPKHRHEQTQKTKACFNCLDQNHTVAECPSNSQYRLCQEKYHTLLQVGAKTTIFQSKVDKATSSSEILSATENIKYVAMINLTNNIMLLAIARVRPIFDSDRPISVHVLLESGESPESSEHVTQQLL
ncbi:hypothetical protein HN011_005707, partial [Eciton burchellii]